MSMARSALPNPVSSATQADGGTSDGAGLSHPQWLATLKTASIVLVRNGRLHFRAMLSDATPCFLHIGKLKFHRRHGWQVKKRRAYRMELRLVRTVEELT